VLERDGHRCQYPLGDGTVCGAPATTAGHIVPRCEGGAPTPANERAECEHHNYADGGRIGARRRRRTPEFFVLAGTPKDPPGPRSLPDVDEDSEVW
jgi:hypothetical protein